MKDNRTAKDRSEIAANLREILRDAQPGDQRDYWRAFCRCVLINFRHGLMAHPRKAIGGQWFPRKRGVKT